MKLQLFLFVVLFSSLVFSQSDEKKETLPQGLSISNQLDISYDKLSDEETFENWFNIDYTNGIFSTGMRIDIFQPNDSDPIINRGKFRYADIAFKYIKADLDFSGLTSTITVGNFYTLFGRGLLLKIYEDRDLRVDNNLYGIMMTAQYNDFSLKALSGMPEKFNAVRADVLHGIDLEYSGINNFLIGLSHVSSLPDIANTKRTTLSSVRVQPTLGNFDLYAEYGIKRNEDIKNNVFKGEREVVGKAFYANLSFYYSKFSIMGEVKHYDNFALVNSDGTVIYNTPPSLRKEYAYVLLNRHPSPLDQSNESGFQLEANYNFSENSGLSANFGITKTLPKSSLYQLVNNLNLDVVTQQKEFFIQGHHEWNNSLHTYAGFGYNEELQTNTKSYTPILENHFHFGGLNTLKVTLEHQFNNNLTSSEEYYSDVLSLEYLRSPSYSISWVTEMETREPDPGKTVRKLWSFIQFGYQFSENIEKSILIGSRQAGNICIGGVCKYEPEFHGVEFSMMTRF